MGNAAQAACCSAGPGPGQHCCSGASRPEGAPSNPGELGVPVAGAPLLSHEVMGVEPVAPPGLDIILEPPGQEDNPNGIPGGDSAAGGDERRADEDTQKVSYDDGSSYAGQIEDGKRNGHGLWQSRTGQYEGQWQGDIQHGKGRQTWSDGRVYEGQFLNGKFAGSGKMIWHTQKGLLIYDGEYQDDLKCGKGKFVWADGRTYDGEWLRGKRHGRGMYMNARCEQKVGFWLNDRFERWEKSGAGGNNGSGKISGGPDDEAP